MTINKVATPLSPLDVEIVLSRPVYRLGETVVGTVRLHGNNEASFAPPRSILQKCQVYAAGRCRIDARWHNDEMYSSLYGTHPHLNSLLDDRVEVLATASEEKGSISRRDGTTVCFWATNAVDLLDLEERPVGHWKNVKPQALKGMVLRDPCSESCKGNLPGAETENNNNNNITNNITQASREQQPLEQQQLSFTFRIDLPLDIPHTLTSTTCHYFYSIVVCAKTVDGELLVVTAPFTIVTELQAHKNVPPPTIEKIAQSTTGRVKLGICLAVAHSAGLPCYISATELHRPQGQVTVNRNVGLCAAVSLSSSHQLDNNVQTMRVADQHGTPCCVLTVIGASVVSPGGRILLQFDFSQLEHEHVYDREQSKNDTGLNNSDTRTQRRLACYQVSACLEGEEVAIHENGSRKKARTFLFDTAHESVELGYTERVSLSMALPLDCPCTIQTDLVDISVRCKIDLTIEKTGGGYSNLRLVLPCNVAHRASADELDNEDRNDTNRVMSLEELMIRNKGNDNSEHVVEESLTTMNEFTKFETNDIMDDLKVLSVLMIDNCGLREEVVT